MKKLFSLGDLYVSDFLKENENNRGGKVDMSLILDEETGLVRLEQAAPLDTMYGKYWYRSGINDTMKKELNGIVNSITDIVKLIEINARHDYGVNDLEKDNPAGFEQFCNQFYQWIYDTTIFPIFSL